MKKKRVYFCPIELVYKKGDKTFTTPKGYPSDGASGATDIYSYSWFAHDRACDVGEWDDGSKMTPREASEMLSWYLAQENRKLRAWYWRWTTRRWTRIVGIGKTGECPSFPELAGQIVLVDGGRNSFYP
jgi:hypothetical protein